MQLRNEFPTMQCYAFGTPACVHLKNNFCSSFIKVESLQCSTSNVKDYVGASKQVTEALDAVLQEDLEKVADTLSRNLPFAVDPKSRKTLDTKCNDEFADIDPSQRIEDKLRKKKDEEWEDVKKDESNGKRAISCSTTHCILFVEFFT
ncbi:hypothetical protein PsorP6_003416 [Peronosclerospora sorghi]|uniref:Uncharacterized protein n=1 Tax=Peronosclerospora sorghi TaxID=230839 RepID=A0ACC0VMS1_9STRA|nr:hypothetical protein PsorP6_003416 [Peronosclerospora sorghi]